MNFLDTIKLTHEPADTTSPQKYNYDTVLKMVLVIGQRLMPKILDPDTKKQKLFTLSDEKRKHFYQQLIYYFFNDMKFEGDLSKGLFINGHKGTGKTIAMQVMRNLYFTGICKTPKGFFLKPCENLVIEYEKVGGKMLENYITGRFCFEDLGTERKDAVHYGTHCNVMKELLFIAYRKWQDSGEPTFITSNYNFELISEQYDIRVEDRFREMYNQLSLTGDSLRR